MQEAQAAGCRTTAEADRFLELKRQREAEEASRRSKDSANAGPSSQSGANTFMALGSVRRDSNSRPAGQASGGHVNDFDILGFIETQLLSEAVSIISIVFEPSLSQNEHNGFNTSPFNWFVEVAYFVLAGETPML